jgi:putative salt-induced outer membrane protein YdiY
MKTAVVLLVMATLCFSQDEVGSPWAGAVSLGSLFTTGNTEVKQIDTGLELSRELIGSVFTAGIEADASYGSQGDETYREKYLTAATLDYSFTENNFASSRSYWTQDELSGINSEYGVSAGLGRRFVNSDAVQVSAAAGAGFLTRENTADSTLETSIWYTGLDLAWKLTDSWSVTESVRFDGDFQNSDNYFAESVLEASSSITGSLSFVLGYDVNYHNLPLLEGGKNTDTAMRLQLRLAI